MLVWLYEVVTGTRRSAHLQSVLTILIDRIVGGWDVVATAKQDTECWLNNTCAERVVIEALLT